MKACIVIPLSDFLDDDKVVAPLGALYIKRYVEEHSNHTVDILCNGENDFSLYDVVGFSTVTANAEYIENLLPLDDKITVLGGPHVTFYKEDLSDKLKDITYLVPGDGCKPFLSILNGKKVSFESDDPNQLPHRDKFIFDQYKCNMYSHASTTMITSRGCPNSCYFCEDANTPMRFKNIESIEKEIIECKELGYKFISLSDDLFCVSLKRVKIVSELMSKHNMYFRCLCRANTFTIEMAETLAKNNCLEVGFGAESGSQKILDIINKNTTVKQIKRTIDIIKKTGMYARASFMIGLPGENHNTISETFNLIKYSDLDDFVAFVYHPYRGTYIFDNIKKFDIVLPKNYNHYMHLLGKQASVPNSGISTKKLSESQIQSYHRDFKRLKITKMNYIYQ